jgi:hypothetical protein
VRRLSRAEKTLSGPGARAGRARCGCSELRVQRDSRRASTHTQGSSGARSPSHDDGRCDRGSHGDATGGARDAAPTAGLAPSSFPRPRGQEASRERQPDHASGDIDHHDHSDHGAGHARDDGRGDDCGDGRDTAGVGGEHDRRGRGVAAAVSDRATTCAPTEPDDPRRSAMRRTIRSPNSDVILNAALALATVALLVAGAHEGARALQAAGLTDNSGAIGGVANFVSSVTDNVKWLAATGIGLAIAVVGLLFTLGHPRAHEIAIKA